MNFGKIAIRAAMGCCVVLFAGLCGCSGKGGSSGSSSPGQVYSSAETADFTRLAKETLAELDAGHKTEMVAKLTDLESAWDDNEAKLRPKNEETWVSLDKTLDVGISSLRSSRTDFPKGRAALEDLIRKLHESTKP